MQSIILFERKIMSSSLWGYFFTYVSGYKAYSCFGYLKVFIFSTYQHDVNVTTFTNFTFDVVFSIIIHQLL